MQRGWHHISSNSLKKQQQKKKLKTNNISICTSQCKCGSHLYHAK